MVNAPGTNNVAVAELAVGLMLDVARRISLCDRDPQRTVEQAAGLPAAGKPSV